MIYQPKNIQPTGFNSIDAFYPTNITMQMSTNTYVNQYELKIYSLSGNTVYDTGLVSVNSGTAQNTHTVNYSQAKTVDSKLDWSYNFEASQMTVNVSIVTHNLSFTDSTQRTGNITLGTETQSFTYTIGTVSGASDTVSLGTVVFNTPIASGTAITLGCNLPFEQGSVEQIADQWTIIPYDGLYNEETLTVQIGYEGFTALQNGVDYTWDMRLYEPIYDMEVANGYVGDVTSQTQFLIDKGLQIDTDMKILISGVLGDIQSYDSETGAIVLSSAMATPSPVVKFNYYQIMKNYLDLIPRQPLYARDTPVVSFTISPEASSGSAYMTRKLQFKGSYQQQQNVPITWHKWQIYEVKLSTTEPEVDTLILETDPIYSARMEYTYETFRPLKNYKVVLTVFNEMGVTVSHDETFLIGQMPIEYSQEPVASLICEKNAIKVDWVTPTSFPGGEFDSNCILTTGLGGTNILNNTPYNGTNSLDTSTYTVGYQNDKDVDLGMAVMPTAPRITTQFKLDENFFYNSDGSYKSFSSLVMFPTLSSTFGEARDGLLGSIFLFIDGANLGVAETIPDASVSEIAQYYPGYGQNLNNGYYSQINVLTTTYDFNENPYILCHIWHLQDDCESECYFLNKVVAVAEGTQSGYTLLTLANPIPQKNDIDYEVYPLTARLQPFYTGTTPAFVLQENTIVNPNYDYQWIDDSNSWIDSDYWVEGGGAIARLLAGWWKVEVTDTEIKIARGGS